MTGQPRRIGLMGCGTVADHGHIPAIQRTDGLSLNAIYDPSADALERTQKPHGIPEAFTDAGMFFDSGILKIRELLAQRPSEMSVPFA